MRSKEIKKALKIIYQKGDVQQKQNVVQLIDTLIEKGSSHFWHLKEIFEKS